MLKLLWTKKPAVRQAVVNEYMNKMQIRANQDNVFAILLPIAVYDYIKKEDINADISKISSDGAIPFNTVWVLVKQPEKE